MKHKIEYYLMISFVKLLMMFPEKTRYNFAEKLGIMGYHLIKKRRMIALANLKLAFPEKTDEERVELAKKNYKVLTKAYLSSLWIMDYIFDETKVNVENYHILDEAVAENKGLIIATMHMGNLEASLKITEKYRLSDVVKAQRNPYIDEYITKNRSQLNFNMIKKSKSTPKELLKVIKNKEILALFSDHRDKGTTVNFFGRDTIAPTGAIHFALKFKVPLVFGYSILNENNTNTVKIIKRIELIETGNLKDDVRVNTQNLIHLMEEAIRENPEQWMWFHDRWRLSKEFKK
ncbi:MULTISPECIES: lysophospholipid acyltransferase family protein [Psychrilyobacter]|uniref:Lauroyl acyltransferase n=1 Tax=Psychrilyobacter piezotolerans TaxID=2293438 RepID=A0ABX9KFW3_9FUSO|nr:MULTISPECIES: lysophospholipid acyltransferase family protein [Psychrilyobacter]MCS5421396.1 lysophospholipid acyltransferase family protein [Psychrilyobacter sp. S5]NDI78483.1 lysophospholipid acyltransferase family protein [Psychrilyobacter piezotolerans]RDE60668.1 lauroyl acyltransferase [Psychrilyobacter sp. S5]REI40595.1 lauroyl acyltransferase [Psychrilyobacter piezotolerans]